jgi:hypothetical protein
MHQSGYAGVHGQKGKQFGVPTQEYFEGHSQSGAGHNVRNSQSGAYRESNYQGEHLARNQMPNSHQQIHERNSQYAGNPGSQGATQNYQNTAGYPTYKASQAQSTNSAANTMKQQQQQSFGRRGLHVSVKIEKHEAVDPYKQYPVAGVPQVSNQTLGMLSG